MKRRLGIAGKVLISAVLTASMLAMAGCGVKKNNVQVVPEIEFPTEEEVFTEPEESGAAEGDLSEQEESFGDVAPADADGDLLHPFIVKVNRYYRVPDSSYRSYLRFFCEAVELTEEESSQYPALGRALDDCFTQNYMDLSATVDEYKSDALDFTNSMGDQDNSAYYTIESSVDVIRADRYVFSTCMNTSEYLGGAHGMTVVSGQNFDSQTGEVITLDQAFTDMDGLTQAVYDELINKYGNEGYYNGSLSIEEIKPFIDDGSLVFWFDCVGVNVVFNAYDIAPYAAGPFKVELPYGKYAGIINPAYSMLPSSYIVKIGDVESYGSLETMVDLNGDGNLNQVTFETQSDDYFRISNITVGVDGQTTSYPVDCFSYTNYLVCDNGRYYLYAQYRSDNDYASIEVYELTADGVTRKSGDYGTDLHVAGFGSQGEETEEYWGSGSYTYALTDPAHMKLAKHTDMLSTVDGTNIYVVGDDGAIVSADGRTYYRLVEAQIELTAKVDVEGTLVDADGNEGGSYTIEAGDKVIYYATDDQTYADLQTSDGSLVRVQVVTGDWPRTINGMDIMEVFDGTRFAG